MKKLAFLLLLCLLLQRNVEFLQKGIAEEEVNEVALAIGDALFDCENNVIGLEGLGR